MDSDPPDLPVDIGPEGMSVNGIPITGEEMCTLGGLIAVYNEFGEFIGGAADEAAVEMVREMWARRHG